MKGLLGATTAVLTLLLAGVASSAGTPRKVGIAYVTGSSTGAAQVWLASANGSHRHRLGPGGQPLLSPNGEMVAVESVAAVVLYSSTGRVVARFSHGAFAYAHPLAWSPDSRYLAVGFPWLAVIDARTRTAKTIIPVSKRGDAPFLLGVSFAPTGPDRLVYAFGGSFGTGGNLFTASADRTGSKQLTHDRRDGNPVWGKHGIVFVRQRSVSSRGPFQVWLLSGRRATQLTHLKIPIPRGLGLGGVGLVPVAVSADGNHVLCNYHQGGDTSDEAWTLTVATRRARQIEVGGAPVTGWGISRDGRAVLVDTGGFMSPPSSGAVESVPFSGGNPKVLVPNGGSPSWNR